MSMKRLVLAPLALSLLSVCPPAGAADIVGAWQIHGSVFFNAVDTICHFRREESGVTATCESDGVLGPFTPAMVSHDKVEWSWDSGPAVLTFQAKLQSDSTMTGEIKVRGFTGDFKARKL